MNILEQLSPLKYAMTWDNVGLLVGREEKEVKTIMIALDATDEVIDQAISKNVDMLITHHPLIFSSMKRITEDGFIGSRILKLIGNDISYYAMHTNFDVAGMAEAAADKIDLIDREVLEPIYIEEDEKSINIIESNQYKTQGIGRTGNFIKVMTLEECARFVKQRFDLEYVTVSGELTSKIDRVSISTGSGKSFVEKAIKQKAQLLITGDIDHHTAIDAKARGLSIIDAGHFGTERFMVSYVKDYLENYLKNKININIAIIIAKETSPFQIVK